MGYNKNMNKKRLTIIGAGISGRIYTKEENDLGRVSPIKDTQI